MPGAFGRKSDQVRSFPGHLKERKGSGPQSFWPGVWCTWCKASELRERFFFREEARGKTGSCFSGQGRNGIGGAQARGTVRQFCPGPAELQWTTGGWRHKAFYGLTVFLQAQAALGSSARCARAAVSCRHRVAAFLALRIGARINAQRAIMIIWRFPATLRIDNDFLLVSFFYFFAAMPFEVVWRASALLPASLSCVLGIRTGGGHDQVG